MLKTDMTPDLEAIAKVGDEAIARRDKLQRDLNEALQGSMDAMREVSRTLLLADRERAWQAPEAARRQHALEMADVKRKFETQIADMQRVETRSGEIITALMKERDEAEGRELKALRKLADHGQSCQMPTAAGLCGIYAAGMRNGFAYCAHHWQADKPEGNARICCPVQSAECVIRGACTNACGARDESAAEKNVKITDRDIKEQVSAALTKCGIAHDACEVRVKSQYGGPQHGAPKHIEVPMGLEGNLDLENLQKIGKLLGTHFISFHWEGGSHRDDIKEPNLLIRWP